MDRDYITDIANHVFKPIYQSQQKPNLEISEDNFIALLESSFSSTTILKRMFKKLYGTQTVSPIQFLKSIELLEQGNPNEVLQGKQG